MVDHCLYGSWYLFSYCYAGPQWCLLVYPFPATVSWCQIWSGIYIVRSFWIFTSTASMSCYGQLNILARYLMTGRAYVLMAWIFFFSPILFFGGIWMLLSFLPPYHGSLQTSWFIHLLCGPQVVPAHHLTICPLLTIIQPHFSNLNDIPIFSL